MTYRLEFLIFLKLVDCLLTFRRPDQLRVDMEPTLGEATEDTRFPVRPVGAGRLSPSYIPQMTLVYLESKSVLQDKFRFGHGIG
ncbi:MAG: hypothetical protein LR011_07940 [Verrucomicrobia bacterium]|nr:hypothetical protein [Verrucomicrobiota bacterium]